MSSTTRFGLRAPDGPENADVPLYIRNLASDVDPWLSRSQPRTQAQITAIASPLVGQQVFNTTVGRSQEWNGTTWRSIGGTAVGKSTVTLNGAAGVWIPVEFFIGLGYTEVTFAFSSATNISFKFRAEIVTDSSNAIVQGSPGNSAPYYSLGTPTSSTDAVLVGTNGNQGRNFRLDPDGFVRFELTSPNNAVSSLAHTVNWRAR